MPSGAASRIGLAGRHFWRLITLHGTLDVLVPISRSGDVYDDMIKKAGRGGLHRYYRITGGTHTDGLYAAHPGLVRPMLPCFRTAFDAMTAWTEHGVTPPPSHTVPRPDGQAVNTCVL